jgi:hypothetical protein
VDDFIAQYGKRAPENPGVAVARRATVRLEGPNRINAQAFCGVEAGATMLTFGVGAGAAPAAKQ